MINRLNPQSIRYDMRFDIGFKLLYLLGRGLCDETSKKIYLKHISALTGGTMTEPGDKTKSGAKEFLKRFNDLGERIDKIGFDPKISQIPLGVNGVALNGAHRISHLLHKNLFGYAVINQVEEPNYSSNFFKRAGMQIEELDWAANALVYALKDARLFVIWPKANDHVTEIKQAFNEIIYERKILTNLFGLNNIVRNVYLNETWAQELKGIQEKAFYCSSGKETEQLTILVVKGNNDEENRKLKDKIRIKLKLNNHSIHSSDDHLESIRLSRTLFNENFIEIIKYIPNEPNNIFFSMMKNLGVSEKYNSFLEPYVVTGSSILGLLDCRKCNDIDILKTQEANFNIEEYLGSHEDQLKYYPLSKNSMIFDPRNSFYFNGIKFLNLENVIKMKEIRAEQKDLNDLKLLGALRKNSKVKNLRILLTALLKRYHWNVKLKIIKIMKLIGIFPFVRSLYKKLKFK